MGAGPLCKSQHNYTCNSVAHSHQNLPGPPGHLSVEWIGVEEVGAVELLAVGLEHGDDVLLASEYLNLEQSTS